MGHSHTGDRPQREGQVRTWKESNGARGTHKLETAEGRSGQGMVRKWPSEGHSHSGYRRGRDESGHRRKVTKLGHLQTGDRRGRNKLGHEKKEPSKGHSPPGDHRGRNKSGHGKKVTERGVLTLLRPYREGQVRQQKESDQMRGTHILKTAEGGASHDPERKRLNKGHPHTGDGRGKDESGHGKKATKRGAHTNWRPQGGTSQDM